MAPGSMGHNIGALFDWSLRTIPAQDVLDYQRVKAAILDRYKVTEETQRQWFQGLCYKPGNRPKALIAEVNEYATRWLKPQTPGERAVIDKAVLEQVFLSHSLPSSGMVDAELTHLTGSGRYPPRELFSSRAGLSPRATGNRQGRRKRTGQGHRRRVSP